MFDGKLIQRAAITGIALQVTMVVVGHYVPWVRLNFYEFGAMMFAGLAGLFYARDYGKGYARGALGGAIAGGTSGIIGISLANILGDVALVVLPFGAALTILTGAIGGLFGQMGANIRKLSA
ncbi:MAG TPA: hypothetical protein VNU97_06990 [Rhizomicrobium sp.]|nr:hypothetical protein [Rhizomicrobium sp.]